jgi:hypothetical protein
MKYKLFSIFIIVIMMILGTQTVYASSWHWKIAPPLLVLLPFAIIFTLIVETVSIVKFGEVKKSFKVFCVIIVPNLLSFAASFLDPIKDYIDLHRSVVYDVPFVYSFFKPIKDLVDIYSSNGYNIMSIYQLIEESARYGPYYIIVFKYLILTFLIEIPFVYLVLRKDTLSRKKLAISILTSNVITTLVIAVCERIFFTGTW